MDQIQHNIETCFERTWDGLRFTVIIPSRLEDFFRSVSQDSIESVSDYGRGWRPISNDSAPLRVYTLSPELGGQHNLMSGRDPLVRGFRLDSVSGKLGGEVVNLSFLRLVGASQPGGVSFMIPGVFSEERIAALNQGIDMAIADFCRNYVKPIKIKSTICIVEQTGGSNEFKEVREIG